MLSIPKYIKYLIRERKGKKAKTENREREKEKKKANEINKILLFYFFKYIINISFVFGFFYSFNIIFLIIFLIINHIYEEQNC